MVQGIIMVVRNLILKFVVVKVMVFVGFLCFGLVVVVIVLIVQMYLIGKELINIVEKDILLMEVISYVINYQLEQVVFVECMMCLFGFKVFGEVVLMEEVKICIIWLEIQVVDEILMVEDLVEKVLVNFLILVEKVEFVSVLKQFKQIEGEYVQYKFYIDEVLYLIEIDVLEIVNDFVYKLEEEQEWLDYELVVFLIEIEIFMCIVVLVVEQYEKVVFQ